MEVCGHQLAEDIIQEGRAPAQPHGMPLQVHGPPARNFISRRADQDQQNLQDNQDMAIAGGSRSCATAWKTAAFRL